VLKPARTIADLAGSEQIQTPHVAEALKAAAQAEIDDGAILFSWGKLGGLPPAGTFPAKYAGIFGGLVSGAHSRGKVSAGVPRPAEITTPLRYGYACRVGLAPSSQRHEE